MKRLFVFVCALLLGASLTFAQDTGGTKTTPQPKAESGKKTHKSSKKSHKGGKKSKKGASTDTTTPPPK